MKNITDKRSEERKPVSHPVRFEFTMMEAGHASNIRREGSGIDQSHRGMGIMTEFPLKQGQILRLFLPETEEHAALPLFTEVMWTGGREGQFRTGLRFLN